MITGSVIRVELVPGPRVFDLMIAALLLPLGIWLAATRPARDHALAHRHRAGHRRHRRRLPRRPMQSRLPDTLIRRIVGILAIAIAAHYLWLGLG